MEGVLSGTQPSPGASKPQSAWHHLKCCETGAGPVFRRLFVLTGFPRQEAEEGRPHKTL